MSRLTYTDEELAEFENMDCPVKANDLVNRFCDRVCDEFQSNCPFKELGKKLKAYEDKQEQGLLIELPCKVGDTVYVWNYCDCVCTSRDWETGIEECPFENDCEFEECKEGNERFFKTRIESIWNNGQGWYFNVLGLHLEISINAIGKTVFLTDAEAEEARQIWEVRHDTERKSNS